MMSDAFGDLGYFGEKLKDATRDSGSRHEARSAAGERAQSRGTGESSEGTPLDL